MVAEPLTETESLTPASETSTPPSEAPAGSVLETGQETAAAKGSETPETGDGEPAARKVEEYALPELDQLYKEGKLTDSALVDRRESLRQSENDRQQVQRQRLADARAADNTRREAEDKAFALFQQRILDIQDADASPEVKAVLLARELGDLKQGLMPTIMAVETRSLDDTLLAPQFYGDTADNRAWLRSATHAEKVRLALDRAYQLGQEQGPGGDKKVTPASEWVDGVHQPTYQKASDDWRAKNPGIGAASTSNGASSGGLPSIESWQTWTLEQREEARKRDPDIELKMMGMTPS